MPTTHDDDATIWRDLTDALTPNQIAYLEHWEARPDEPPMADGSAQAPERHAAGLLFRARQYAQENAAGAYFADVAPPPDEGVHYPWEHDGDGKWFRFFAGTTRELEQTTVTITGLQYTDGTINRSISVDGDDEGLDAAQARRIAAALLDAADELDRLND